MSDNVKMWMGEYLFGIGYPMMIVTTQDRKNNEYPGEFFLWVQEVPSLKYKAIHQAVIGTETTDEQKADGITMTQEIVEEEALNFAKGQVRRWQFERYKDDNKYEASLFKECELAPVDWKKTLLTLRRQDRLDEKLVLATANDTLSESLRSYLHLLVRTSPLTKNKPHPYETK